MRTLLRHFKVRSSSKTFLDKYYERYKCKSFAIYNFSTSLSLHDSKGEEKVFLLLIHINTTRY